MPSISPDEVAELIYNEFDYFNAPVSLRETILRFAQRVNVHVSELTLAEDILDRDLQKYVSSLIKKEQRIQRSGLFCSYQVLADNDEIVGFSYPRPLESPMMQKLRRVAPEVSKAFEAINQLHHSDFELFCSRILDLMQAEETLKTQDSYDEGIDFLGWLCIPDTFANIETISQFRKDFRMLVIGQAKRYGPDKSPVGEHEIRELVGTVVAFHHDQLAPWTSRLQLQPTTLTVISPILPLIMTTGRISPQARSLAKKCGVVARDGAEIALFICLEGVGMSEVEEHGFSKLKFDSQRFMEWLHRTNA
jgi:Restriction endonuclease